jgi:hypothetical protein
MLHRCLTAAFAAAAVVIAALPASAQTTPPCEQAASIGVATMTADGVITLRLRSLPPGPIAEATMRYAPGDPKYADVVTHFGGLAPGETEPLRPWC